MESLIVLLVLVAYAAVAVVAAYWVYSVVTRRGLGIALRTTAPLTVLLTFWAVLGLDHELGKRAYRQLCEKEAGTRIKRSISQVEGYRSDFASSDTPKQLGYRYVEKPNTDGTVDRYSIGAAGNTVEERAVRPIARYALVRKQESIEYHIYRTEYQIVDLQVNEKLANHTAFGYQGGWLARQFSSMFVSRNRCPSEQFDLGGFIRVVLKARATER